MNERYDIKKMEFYEQKYQVAKEFTFWLLQHKFYCNETLTIFYYHVLNINKQTKQTKCLISGFNGTLQKPRMYSNAVQQNFLYAKHNVGTRIYMYASNW